ncbi:MAG: 16S rRNA (guanine(527)-N(7))-methyltransferase RsmG [Deltaproteobacteria bacterium]|nr:16S rRNA (guanine(527)-N(7))-methyltransferase RsmG [Deltaproteobacteria bacterium]
MNLADELIRGAGLLGLDLTARQIEQFMVYLAELQRWNKTYNLTTISEPAAIIHKHFLDSLNYIKALDDCAEILDLGSGAGFPGLPLAIVRPQSKFVLVDGRRKKTLFLNYVVQKLGLKNVEIIHLHLSQGNAREIFKQPFSALVTRAVAVLREVVPVADSLLENRGVLIFSDAHPDRQMIEAGLEKWPELSLEKLEKTKLSGRSSDIYLGTIRKEQYETC